MLILKISVISIMLQILHLNCETFTGDWHYCEVPNIHESAIIDIDSTCYEEKISQNSELSWIPKEGEYVTGDFIWIFSKNF